MLLPHEVSLREADEKHGLLGRRAAFSVWSAGWRPLCSRAVRDPVLSFSRRLGVTPWALPPHGVSQESC